MSADDPGGLRAHATRLPRAARMRYWKPAPELAGLVSGYHLYALDAPSRDVFQPAWANLRMLLTPGTRWRVRVGEGVWTGVGACTLFGPSSAVTWSESDGGIVVGAGITPRGWARLGEVSAAEWANRVAPCEEILGEGVAGLHAILLAAERDDALPPMLDAFLLGAMHGRGRHDTVIGRVEQALLDPAIATVAGLAERVGSTPRSLERLATRAFGFAPKLLLRRARFLRSLHAIRGIAPAERAAAIDPGYSDYSHFVRDAHAFLGMSPQAFLRLDNPLFVQSARLRSAVLGAPAQALGTR